MEASDFINGKYFYLYFNIIILIVNTLLSLYKPIGFYKHKLSIFLSLTFTFIIIQVWDKWFKDYEIWSFNPNLIIGNMIGSLPVEQLLFNLNIVFFSILVYKYLKTFHRRFEKISVYFHFGFILFCFGMAVFNAERIYTFVVFSALAIFLTIQYFVYKLKHMGFFYLTWIIIIIPYFIAQYFITQLQIIKYNFDQCMGRKFSNFPGEDLFFLMLICIINISIYEFFKTINIKPYLKIKRKLKI